MSVKVAILYASVDSARTPKVCSKHVLERAVGTGLKQARLMLHFQLSLSRPHTSLSVSSHRILIAFMRYFIACSAARVVKYNALSNL